MRLRYLHLQNYPPIADIKVCFASGSPLARECAIRFVVGLNGSGKSNLLRAVAEVFLALADLRVPAFPISLVYELGVRGSPNHRTLLLHCPGNRQKASLWLHERFAFDDQSSKEDFVTCIEDLNLGGVPGVPGFSALIVPGNWPLRDSSPPQIALPTAVLAYSTGDLRPWRSVWNRNQRAEGLLDGSNDSQNDERPAGWTAAQEYALQAARLVGSDIPRQPLAASSAETDRFRRPVLLDATLLKCALLAVALQQAFSETGDNSVRAETDTAMARRDGHDPKKSTLQELLERGGWHQLVSVAFRSRLQTTLWDQKLCETAHDWWLCASEVITEPHPVEQRRTVWFDLNGPFDAQGPSFLSAARNELQTCTRQGEALWALLGGAKDTSSFDLFTRLLELRQRGLFDDILMRLRRAAAPSRDYEASANDVGVLRYEELSDGEQMVLGRMALFHLLRGQQDALLLLDEPETHFNDRWKREIVDIIDDAIGQTSNDVLISTHSAIVLSDVFNNEIVMVQKTSEGSTVRSVDEPTFATDPSALMMTVFGADDSIGKRAQAMAAMPVAQKAALAAWVQTVAALATQFQPTPAPWPTNRPIASEPDWEAFKALMQAFYKKGLESGLPYTPNGTPVAAGGVSYADYVRIFRDEHRLSLNADSHEVCVLCGGRLGQTPEVDHWVSQSAFPLLSVCADNLLPTCGDCNSTANKGQKNVHSAGSFVDWFHPYLRPGHGAIQLVYQSPDLHVRCSAIALAHQPKATALDALLNLSSRWTREFKAKYAERKDVLIRRERKRLQSGQARHTEGEILSYVQEWEEDLSLSEPHYEVHRTLAAALQEQSRLSAWLGELSFVQ